MQSIDAGISDIERCCLFGNFDRVMYPLVKNICLISQVQTDMYVKVWHRELGFRHTLRFLEMQVLHDT